MSNGIGNPYNRILEAILQKTAGVSNNPSVIQEQPQTPNIDLGRPPVMGGGPQVTPPSLPPSFQEEQGGTNQQSTPRGGFPNIPPEVLKYLPQLAAGLIGMTVPGALPGAAGFATGYEGSLSKQREQRRKTEIEGTERQEERTYKEGQREIEFERKKELKGMGGLKESANIVKQRKAIQSAKSVIKTLKQQLDKIPSTSGPMARVKGIGANIAGKVGLDETVSTYNNLRKSVLGQLAKIVSGESGRLTDQDIARIEAAVPRTIDTTEERELAWSLLQTLLSEQELTFGFNKTEFNSVSANDYVSGLSGNTGKTSSGIGYTIEEE